MRKIKKKGQFIEKMEMFNNNSQNNIDQENNSKQ